MLLLGGGCAATQNLPAVSVADRESAQWQMTQLDLDVTVVPATHTLQVHGTMRLVLKGAPSVGPTLHLGKASRFVSVQLDDNPKATFYLSPQTARIRFPSSQPSGSTLTLAFRFESGRTGCPVAVTSKSAYARCHGDWYPAPLQGVPAAPGTMTLVVPAGWRTVSNGTLLSSVGEGKQCTERWTLKRPAARSFVAGPYHVETKATGDRIVGTYLLAADAAIRTTRKHHLQVRQEAVDAARRAVEEVLK